MVGLDLEQGLRGAPLLRGSHLLSGHFCPLGSGSTDLIKSGSNPDLEHWIQSNLMIGLDLEQGLRGALVLRGSHIISGHFCPPGSGSNPDPDPKH